MSQINPKKCVSRFNSEARSDTADRVLGTNHIENQSNQLIIEPEVLPCLFVRPSISDDINTARVSTFATICSREDKECVYLQAAPECVFGIRHGDIKIAKHQKWLGLFGLENSHEYTAFQMATIGLNPLIEYDNDVEEGIELWFSKFGFENEGRLIPQPADEISTLDKMIDAVVESYAVEQTLEDKRLQSSTSCNLQDGLVDFLSYQTQKFAQ